MTQYFHLETQRWRMIKSLIASRYTCRADVDIWVRGGGVSGQCEACIPAIGKAIAKMDSSQKKILRKGILICILFKIAGCLATDPRQVERKHTSKKKARKGESG